MVFVVFRQYTCHTCLLLSQDDVMITIWLHCDTVVVCWCKDSYFGSLSFSISRHVFTIMSGCKLLLITVQCTQLHREILTSKSLVADLEFIVMVLYGICLPFHPSIMPAQLSVCLFRYHVYNCSIRIVTVVSLYEVCYATSHQVITERVGY